MHQHNIAEQRRAEREVAQTLVGCTLDDRYHLDALLGQGGFAVVYRATDLRMGTLVAVKVAKPGASDIAPRFGNEVTLSARLSPDRNIARATDRGTLASSGPFDGCPYLVADLIPGQELSDALLRHSRFPLPAAARIARDLLRALAHLHERGIVHRDIKPANVMVREDGSAVLIDLGLAFATGEGEEPRSPDLTAAREIVGTKLYMSPEQGLGFRPASPFDIYALGVTLYQTLAGSPPFRAIPDQTILKHKLNNKIPPISRLRPDTPPAFADAIMSMLAKTPEERPTASGLLEQLKALGTGPLPAANTPTSPKPESEAPEPGSPSAPSTDDLSSEPTVLKLDPLSSPRRRGEASPIEGWEDEEPQEAPADKPAAQRAKFRRGFIIALLVIAAALVAWIALASKPTPNTLRPVQASDLLPSPPAPEEPQAPPGPSPSPSAEPEAPESAEPRIALPGEERQPPVEPPPRHPKKTPPPKTAPNTTPPKPEPPHDCAANRTNARKAIKANDWKAVVAATKDASCWSSKTERARLRATAFFKQGRYAQCVRAAAGASGQELGRLRSQCYLAMEEQKEP
jgi:serine/threonine-protein kinase